MAQHSRAAGRVGAHSPVTLLPDSGRLLRLLGTSVALAVVPGPAVLCSVARTVAQGVRVGLASVAGVAIGPLGNAWAASLGIAALVSVWPGALGAMRVAGAAWLLWLAWQALRAASRGAADGPSAGDASPRRVFVDGAAVALPIQNRGQTIRSHPGPHDF